MLNNSKILYLNSSPERILLCDSHKTQKISMWYFYNIKDEILGNYTYIVIIKVKMVS